jgi:membrane protein YdbS with pleckstrin-like domain
MAESDQTVDCIIAILCYVGKKLNYARTECRIYPDRLEFEEGFFATSRKTIQFVDVKEVTLHKGFLQRICGLGTIYLATIATGTVGSSNRFPWLGLVNASASGIALRDIGDSDAAFERIRGLVISSNTGVAN